MTQPINFRQACCVSVMLVAFVGLFGGCELSSKPPLPEHATQHQLRQDRLWDLSHGGQFNNDQREDMIRDQLRYWHIEDSMVLANKDTVLIRCAVR